MCRCKISRTWWKSCAPITPSTVLCFSGVNNGKRRTPISRGCWRRCRASPLSPWCSRWTASPPRQYGPYSPLSVKGCGTMGRLVHQHWKEVERNLGADDGVLMVDGSDFPQEGGHSVG